MNRLLPILSVLAMVAVSQALLPPGVKEKHITDGFPCLMGVRPPHNIRRVMKSCYGKAEEQTKIIVKNYNVSAPTWQMIEDINMQKEDVARDCIISVLGYETRNGSLNTTKIREHLNGFEAPNFVIKFRVMTLMGICAIDSKGSNATEQFANFQFCVEQSLADHCNLEKEMVEMFLDRESTPSPCASVGNFDYFLGINMTQIEAECKSQAAMIIPNVTNNQRGSYGRRRMRDEYFQINRDIERFIMQVVCATKKTGMSSEKTGTNFTAFRDYISNLTGWNRQVLANVTAAFDSCDIKFAGDINLQGYLWDACLPPKIVRICGFNNTFIKNVLPIRYPEIAHAATIYAKFKIGLENYEENSSGEDDSDEDRDMSREQRGNRRNRRSKDSDESNENSSSVQSEESNETNVLVEEVPPVTAQPPLIMP